MKKILLMAVVICLAVVSALFTSCKKEQKSSYQYIVALDDSVDQDPSMSMQFELNGLPVIEAEMKKSADQSGSTMIFKDTKSNADKRAKEAFAAGIAKLVKVVSVRTKV